MIARDRRNGKLSAHARRRAPATRRRPDQKRRALCACALVTSLVAATALAGSLKNGGTEQPAVPTAPLRDRAETSLAQSGDESLARFEREVMPLSGYDDVRAAGNGAVVGFTMPTSADDAFSSITATLTARGWTAVESGHATAGSFVKEEGDLTWAFVHATDVAGCASVVVTCA